MDAAFVAEIGDGENSRFHLLFMSRKALNHGDEQPGTAQITITPER